MPIIILSFRDNVEDKLRAFNLGVDDYMTKPFNISELLARINAVLRRSKVSDNSPVQPSFVCGYLKVNFAVRSVTLADVEVKLTSTEYNLLQQLALNAGKVMTHKSILERIWGPEYQQEKEYLRVFIGHLRAKIEPDPLNPRYITTVYGVGYKIQGQVIPRRRSNV